MFFRFKDSGYHHLSLYSSNPTKAYSIYNCTIQLGKQILVREKYIYYSLTPPPTHLLHTKNKRIKFKQINKFRTQPLQILFSWSDCKKNSRHFTMVAFFFGAKRLRLLWSNEIYFESFKWARSAISVRAFLRSLKLPKFAVISYERKWA